MIYTAGYGAGWTVNALRLELEARGAWLVDIRLNPTSNRKEWRREQLKQALPRYAHLPELGNVNYKGGAVELRDRERGLLRLKRALGIGPVILLCACRDPLACHRSVVASLAAAQTGEGVFHLDPPLPEKTVACLTIRQPWAWAIQNGFKEIENRDWSTNYRGPLAIHAAKGLGKSEYESAAKTINMISGVAVPQRNELQYGAVVAISTLLQIVTDSDDPFFFGDFGWRLSNVHPVGPFPANGRLGLWGWSYPIDLAEGIEARRAHVAELKALKSRSGLGGQP